MALLAFWANPDINAVFLSDGYINGYSHLGEWRRQLEFLKQSSQPFGAAVVLKYP